METILTFNDVVQIVSNRYKKRIEDLNNNCNDETIIDIYLNISRENFNMELVKSFEYKNMSKTGKNILLDILSNSHEYVNNYLLTKHNITFFVPSQPSSYDIKKNRVEICYYHDNVKYSLMKITEDDDLIGVPNIGRKELEILYMIDYAYIPIFKPHFFELY